jgi:anti-sigma regulatory factor (Ser/Thr protein kinase)
MPVWGRCLYDTATAPAAVLDVVERTHPYIVTPAGGRQRSGRYQHTAEFQCLPAAPDPLEQSKPVIELTGSSPGGARHALAQVGHGRIPDPVLADLLVGTSEAVSNALLHGRPPVTIRTWATADRIVIHVHDTGPGPADPLAGLIPPANGAADPGLGLWLTHQLDIDVALIYGDHGFTVRLRAGTFPI